MRASEIITIAIIDDHQIFLDGMTSALKSQENFNVLYAENSAMKALQRLKELVPDIIITDMSMPDMSGIEFVRIVRKKYPTVKILALTMFDDLITTEQLDGYFLKETDINEVVKAIHGIVLEGKKYHYEPRKKVDTLEFKNTILTNREKEIVVLITEEFTSDEIAEKLKLSKATIETHRKNIYFKLKVNNIAGLTKKAIHLGMIK